MGLFSFLRKNKQDAPADHSAYVARDDDAAAAEARSKRASNAGGGAKARRPGKDMPDPVLPEKKRARRRLVGAIALALAVAVGLPMLLDSEPKPLSSDIEIQIPAKDKPAAASASASASTATPAGAATPPAAASAPAAERRDAGLDPSEEVVDPKAAATVPAPVSKPAAPVVAAAPVVNEVRTHSEPALKPPREPAAELPRSAARAELKAETKPVVKAEAKAEVKTEVKHDTKPARTADKPEDRVRPDDSARALAILEGKPAAKLADEGGGRFAVQVAALATQEKVNELQSRLTEAGLRSQAQKGTTAAGGSIIRVRVGPFGSRDEAEKARAKLQKLGLSGSLVPLS